MRKSQESERGELDYYYSRDGVDRGGWERWAGWLVYIPLVFN